MLKHLNNKEEKPKRVVILGAGGFVGSTSTKLLRESGFNVVPLTRKEVDLLEDKASDTLNNILQPGDALVVISAIAPCKSAEMLMNNLRIMEVVSSCVQQQELAHLVYISSDAVYADNVTLATEQSTVSPSSFHGLMHQVREFMITNIPNSPPVAVLRPSLLYGANDPHNGYGPNRFRRLVSESKDITLFGNGEEQRDHIYVHDVAEIIKRTLLNRSQGLLNVATGTSISFREIAELINTKESVRIIPTKRNNPVVHRHFNIDASSKAFPDFQYTNLKKDGLSNVQKELGNL